MFGGRRTFTEKYTAATVVSSRGTTRYPPRWGYFMSSDSPRRRAGYWCRAAARAVLALAFVTYAAAKFTGAQFVIPGYLLDTPVADLGGMDLTWAFFAHSPLYAGFVAVGQLVGAALLTFDRTARLGAAVSLPITANVALVNFGYNIGTETLIISLVLLAINVYLLAGEFSALKACFWDDTKPAIRAPRRVVARAAVFVAGVVGMLWLFATIMRGPAGGQRAIAGDWLVEAATIDGKPISDPTLGGGWLWVTFDPNGHFSARTKRCTLHGKYSVDPAADQFSVRYDPEPLPPIYPGQSFDEHKFTSAEIQRSLDQVQDDKWPINLAGRYHKDGRRLIVTVSHGAGHVEWRLAAHKRPKF